jgi:DNA-binding LytR/AlgR family response regulator
MIRCLAIDDEPLALKLLADYISKIPYLMLIDSCDDVFAAMNVLQNQEINLIFIDIQMPGLTGLQFIQSLSSKPMAIIVTAYKQYALEGYSLDVVDYLLKPVPFERFLKACNKAQELFLLKNKSASSGGKPEYMFVNAGYRMVKVLFDDIVYIEGLRDYIRIHVKSKPGQIVVRSGLKSIKEKLPASSFLQIHKSFIVSINCITAIRKNSLFIDDLELFIGDSYKDETQRILKSVFPDLNQGS